MKKTMEEILLYAKKNIESFEKMSISSNVIYRFNFDGKNYILKKTLMVGENLSPFWRMM